MRCETASKRLSRIVDGVDELPADVAEHLETCLRCQAESARYRRVARSLRQMQEQVASPSPEMAADILAWIEAAEAAEQGSSRVRRIAYLALALSAATAATAVCAVVIANRTRRSVPAAA